MHCRERETPNQSIGNSITWNTWNLDKGTFPRSRIGMVFQFVTDTFQEHDLKTDCHIGQLIFIVQYNFFVVLSFLPNLDHFTLPTNQESFLRGCTIIRNMKAGDQILWPKRRSISSRLTGGCINDIETSFGAGCVRPSPSFPQEHEPLHLLFLLLVQLPCWWCMWQPRGRWVMQQ
jgi:hypothetical protein